MAKEIISEGRLREIISEEAARFKKKLTLEAEKKKLLKRLNEMYMEEEMMEEETLNEWGEFKKAKNDFAATHKAEIDQMMQAYNSMNPNYVDLSTALLGKVKAEYVALAKKYGISGSNDLGLLYKDLTTLVQPMDFNTFERQVQQGGASMVDVAAGSSAGRSKVVGQG